MKKLILLLAALCFTPLAFAGPGPWVCRAKDISGRSWFSSGHFIRQNSYLGAIDQCHKFSFRPRTCKSALAWCVRRAPVSTSRRYVCVARDLRSAAFSMSAHRRSNARAKAIRYCRRNSPYRRSCRIRNCWRRG